MSYHNLHPYYRAHEPKQYMTLDMNSLNPYNYKSLPDKMIPYQKTQDMYYFTRQVNPISLVNLGPEWLNPNNLPVNIRTTIYETPDLNNQQRPNQFQTPQNNPNLWLDNLPAKAGHYNSQRELPPGVPRQISSIAAGKATSFQEFHGMQLY